MNEQFEFSVSSAIGLEKVLQNELSYLGIKSLSKSAGRVYARTDRAGLAKALINLRTADRLFLEAGAFPAADFDELFEEVKSIPWERWIGRDDRLVMEKAKSARSALASQSAIQAVCQKAAYERLCSFYKQERMPETGGTVKARVQIEDDFARIELDICGEPLSKRGYRKQPTEAPLKESIAAALLYLAGWRHSIPLYDPFCGSGTIPIEAALMGLNVPPGILRPFAWEYMPDGGKAEIALAKEAARTEIKPEREIEISGSDAERSSLDAALANAALARVDDRIRFFNADARDAAPFAQRGIVIADPPYGNRLGTLTEADELYSSLAAFRERFAGWDQCFVVDREDFSAFSSSKAISTRIIDGRETRFFHRYLKLS